MRMDTDDFFAFQEVFVYRYYDAPLGEPATILDLGANCGFATLLFAARFPGARIAAVEPHPANVLALRKNLELNRVLATMIPGAAASEDGPCQLVVSTSLTHTLMSPGCEGDSRTITVDGWSVPTLMTRLGWDRIDLLKIDIEGYERTLFADRPVWLTRVNRIIGEVHSSYGLSCSSATWRRSGSPLPPSITRECSSLTAPGSDRTRGAQTAGPPGSSARVRSVARR